MLDSDQDSSKMVKIICSFSILIIFCLIFIQNFSDQIRLSKCKTIEISLSLEFSFSLFLSNHFVIFKDKQNRLFASRIFGILKQSKDHKLNICWLSSWKNRMDYVER